MRIPKRPDYTGHFKLLKRVQANHHRADKREQVLNNEPVHDVFRKETQKKQGGNPNERND